METLVFRTCGGVLFVWWGFAVSNTGSWGDMEPGTVAPAHRDRRARPAPPGAPCTFLSTARPLPVSCSFASWASADWARTPERAGVGCHTPRGAPGAKEKPQVVKGTFLALCFLQMLAVFLFLREFKKNHYQNTINLFMPMISMLFLSLVH